MILLDLTEAELVELERAMETRCRWYETRGYDVPARAENTWRKVSGALARARDKRPFNGAPVRAETGNDLRDRAARLRGADFEEFVQGAIPEVPTRPTRCQSCNARNAPGTRRCTRCSGRRVR